MSKYVVELLRLKHSLDKMLERIHTSYCSLLSTCYVCKLYKRALLRRTLCFATFSFDFVALLCVKVKLSYVKASFLKLFETFNEATAYLREMCYEEIMVNV